jgi:hypothetical protein
MQKNNNAEHNIKGILNSLDAEIKTYLSVQSTEIQN